MAQNEDTTTIRVKVTVRNRLAQLGNKDEEFNDIIERLLDTQKKR